jgi:hypothetical protein
LTRLRIRRLGVRVPSGAHHDQGRDQQKCWLRPFVSHLAAAFPAGGTVALWWCSSDPAVLVPALDAAVIAVRPGLIQPTSLTGCQRHDRRWRYAEVRSSALRPGFPGHGSRVIAGMCFCAGRCGSALSAAWLRTGLTPSTAGCRFEVPVCRRSAGAACVVVDVSSGMSGIPGKGLLQGCRRRCGPARGGSAQ